jgi:malate/lactate dehydrogenase
MAGLKFILPTEKMELREMVRCGIVGLGKVGSTLAFALLQVPQVRIIGAVDIDLNKQAGESEDLYQALCMLGLEDEKIITPTIDNSDILFVCAGSPRQRMKLSGAWETDAQMFQKNYLTVKQIVVEAVRKGVSLEQIYIVTNPAKMLAEKLGCKPIGEELDSMRKYSELQSGIWILEHKGFTNFGVVAECVEIVKNFISNHNQIV